MNGAEAPGYKRLPGRAWGVLGRSSLWHTHDHLLQVQVRGYSEVYRRFYFRDIQALVLQRTQSARLLTVVLAALCVLIFGAAFLAKDAAWIAWTALGTPFAVALAVHAWRGPSCVCHVRTRVETTRLGALGRLRAAQRSFERIRLLVEGVQGQATPQTLEELVLPEAIAAPPPALPPELAAVSGPPPLPAAPTLRRHQALFVLLLCDTLLSTLQVLAPGRAIDAAGLLFGVAEFLVAIFALVEGRRLHLDLRLRRLTRASLVYLCAAFLIAWMSTIYAGVATLWKHTPPTALGEPGPMRWVAAASIPVTLVLGIAGLSLVLKLRARFAGTSPEHR